MVIMETDYLAFPMNSLNLRPLIVKTRKKLSNNKRNTALSTNLHLVKNNFYSTYAKLLKVTFTT